MGDSSGCCAEKDGVSNDTEKSYLDNFISLLALPLESHTIRQSNEHRINSRKWILYYENSCSFSHHSSIFLCCLLIALVAYSELNHVEDSIDSSLLLFPTRHTFHLSSTHTLDPHSAELFVVLRLSMLR